MSTDCLGRVYANGHPRPSANFTENVTNEERAQRAELRREAIFKILMDGPKTTAELKGLFGVSISTINTDVRILGLWDKIGYNSRYNHKQGAAHKHNRKRPSFREYQALTLIKSYPGRLKQELQRLFNKEMFAPCSNSVLNYALLRLESMELIVVKNKKYFYSLIKYTRFDQDTYAGTCGSKNNAKQTGSAKAGQSFHGKTGASVTGTCKFARKDRFMRKEFDLYFTFNRMCDSLNRNGAKCGGRLTHSRDGISYCEICGMVYEQIYVAEFDQLLLSDRVADPPILLGHTAPREFFRQLKTKDKSLFANHWEVA